MMYSAHSRQLILSPRVVRYRQNLCYEWQHDGRYTTRDNKSTGDPYEQLTGDPELQRLFPYLIPTAKQEYVYLCYMQLENGRVRFLKTDRGYFSDKDGRPSKTIWAGEFDIGKITLSDVIHIFRLKNPAATPDDHPEVWNKGYQTTLADTEQMHIWDLPDVLPEKAYHKPADTFLSYQLQAYTLLHSVARHTPLVLEQSGNPRDFFKEFPHEFANLAGKFQEQYLRAGILISNIRAQSIHNFQNYGLHISFAPDATASIADPVNAIASYLYHHQATDVTRLTRKIVESVLADYQAEYGLEATLSLASVLLNHLSPDEQTLIQNRFNDDLKKQALLQVFEQCHYVDFIENDERLQNKLLQEVDWQTTEDMALPETLHQQFEQRIRETVITDETLNESTIRQIIEHHRHSEGLTRALDIADKLLQRRQPVAPGRFASLIQRLPSFLVTRIQPDAVKKRIRRDLQSDIQDAALKQAIANQPDSEIAQQSIFSSYLLFAVKSDRQLKNKPLSRSILLLEKKIARQIAAEVASQNDKNSLEKSVSWQDLQSLRTYNNLFVVLIFILLIIAVTLTVVTISFYTNSVQTINTEAQSAIVQTRLTETDTSNPADSVILPAIQTERAKINQTTIQTVQQTPFLTPAAPPSFPVESAVTFDESCQFQIDSSQTFFLTSPWSTISGQPIPVDRQSAQIHQVYQLATDDDEHFYADMGNLLYFVTVGTTTGLLPGDKLYPAGNCRHEIRLTYPAPVAEQRLIIQQNKPLLISVVIEQSVELSLQIHFQAYTVQLFDAKGDPVDPANSNNIFALSPGIYTVSLRPISTLQSSFFNREQVFFSFSDQQ